MSAAAPGGTVRFWMDGVATLAALSGVAFLVWLNWAQLFPPAPTVPDAPVSLVGATLRGDDAAPVVLVEYSDYMCPFCVRFEVDVLPALQRQYIETGRVQLALKHHPIERLHPGSTRAAEAALCAEQQEMFLPMHTALFREAAGLDDVRVMALAQGLGMDIGEFTQCLAGDVSAQVQRDVAEAQALGLSGTPAFLIGRRLDDGSVDVVEVIRGARPVADFEAAIERASVQRPASQSPTILLLASGGIGMLVFVWRRYRRDQSRRAV